MMMSMMESVVCVVQCFAIMLTDTSGVGWRGTVGSIDISALMLRCNTSGSGVSPAFCDIIYSSHCTHQTIYTPHDMIVKTVVYDKK